MINYLTRIHDALDRLDYYSASISLQHCLFALPPDVKKKFDEPFIELNDLLKKRSALNSSNLVQTRIKQHRFDESMIYPFIGSILREIWNMLFNGGYITKPQYGRDFSSVDWEKAEPQ